MALGLKSSTLPLKHCAPSTDVVKNFSVIKSVSIKTFHCICVYGLGKQSRPKPAGTTHVFFLFDLILYIPVNNFFSYVGTSLPGLNQY